MAEMTARTRHKAALASACAELSTLHKDTPHRRDLQRQINRMQKELRCYDRYHRGWLKLQRANTQSG